MKFTFRKPRLRISKKGKVSLSGGGASFGNKNARINLPKSGVSSTVGGKGMRYNTRRGWNCGFIMLFVLGAGAASLVGVVGWMVA